MNDDDGSKNDEREADLKAPTVEGTIYQRFELSLPFGRTNVDIFTKRVREAAEICERAQTGNGKTVTLDALREVF